MELTKENKLTGVISQGILEEVISKSAKIKAEEREIINFVKDNGLLIREKVKEVETEEFRGLVSDPKDLHVLAAAKLTKCQYLVTLDKKHLLRTNIKKQFKPLQIISPKEFLENYA